MTASAAPRTLSLVPPADSDTEIVRRCLAGDTAAQEALYARHADVLHRMAFQLCGDVDMAADIVQDAFAAAFAQLGKFRGDATLRTWLVAITISCAGRVMRRGRWLWSRTVDLHDRIPTPASSAELDLAPRLDAAIAGLSDKLRVVVVMHDVEGFTHEEIAVALGIPTGTSKARLSDARAKLRVALAPHWKDRTL